MTQNDFRKFVSGLSVALILIGVAGAIVLLGQSLASIMGIKSPSISMSPFEGLFLLGLGSALRMLVRIDQRLEARSM